MDDVRELHEAELRQEFGASELRLESFCQKPLGLQTKLGIAVKRERARQSLHAQIAGYNLCYTPLFCVLSVTRIPLRSSADLRTDDARSASPDSEQIEPTGA